MRPGREGRPAGPMPAGVALGDAGTEGARARRAMAAGCASWRPPGRGLRLPPVGTEVMPPGERRERRREGREAGWAEGGRREERRPGGGGLRQRGREAGSVGGEGEEERAGRGARRRRGSGRGGSVGSKRTLACTLFLSLSASPLSPPRLPRFSVRAGALVTLRHNSPAGCAKLSGKLHRVAGRGRAADPAGQTPGRWRPLRPASFCQRLQPPLPPRGAGPLPGRVGKGREPVGSATRAKMGEGCAPPCPVWMPTVCKSCFSICVNPVSASLSQRGVDFARWGLYPESQAGTCPWTSQKTASLSPATGLLADLRGSNGNFGRQATVIPDITGHHSAEHWTERMSESPGPRHLSFPSDLRKVTWDVWAQSWTETFRPSMQRRFTFCHHE